MRRLWDLSWGAGLLVLAVSAAGSGRDLAPPAEQVAVAGFDGPVRAEVIRIVDGDTFEVSARIWLGEAVDVRVRIEGIDAPELHARCAEEFRRAEAARDYLSQRIAGGEVELSDVRYDKYGGRIRAVVRDGGGNVGEAMIAAGLARPYHGERRRSWCRED